MGSKGFGQPRLELLNAGVQPVGAVVGCEQVGLQRGPGNRRTAALTVAGWLGFGGVDFLQQVTVSVEEAAVDAGCAGDGGDTDLGALRPKSVTFRVVRVVVNGVMPSDVGKCGC